MQAQPRGRKRGAKENIDAGGKKSKKKEEEEEEPKPYVCAIYRRDIASFLPREKIQQWRRTSSFSNASLIEFPSELPRFKYPCLTVIFARADRCIVQKNGFLSAEGMEGEEFNSIFKFRFCCHDVKDRASKLVGQRLFPNKPDNEGVAFKLHDETVVCRVPNLLTKKTAPAMLHFLHHLSQACYKDIQIFPGATADAVECAFNPHRAAGPPQVPTPRRQVRPGGGGALDTGRRAQQPDSEDGLRDAHPLESALLLQLHIRRLRGPPAAARLHRQRTPTGQETRVRRVHVRRGRRPDHQVLRGRRAQPGGSHSRCALPELRVAWLAGEVPEGGGDASHGQGRRHGGLPLRLHQRALGGAILAAARDSKPQRVRGTADRQVPPHVRLGIEGGRRGLRARR